MLLMIAKKQNQKQNWSKTEFWSLVRIPEYSSEDITINNVCQLHHWNIS
jgi:hypothetical protein